MEEDRILAALARGRSEIDHYSAAVDCGSTLDCLERLGIKVERLSRDAGQQIAITGAGLRGLRPPKRELDAGNSGTTMRLLLPAVRAALAEAMPLTV